MNCGCIQQVNEELKKKNLKLSGYAFVMPGLDSRFYINTSWVDKEKAPKGKKTSPPQMFVTYCPFCGKKAESKVGVADVV